MVVKEQLGRDNKGRHGVRTVYSGKGVYGKTGVVKG